MSDAEIKQTRNYREWMEFVDMDLLSAKYLTEAPFHPKPLSVGIYSVEKFSSISSCIIE